MKPSFAVALTWSALALAGCVRPAAPPTDRLQELRTEPLPAPYARLRDAASVAKSAPGPSDWLASHPERGQSLAEFRAARRPIPSAHTTIVLTRLGNVDPRERRVLAQTATYLEAYFARPVRFAADLDLARIPPDAQREGRGFGLQVRTGFVLDSLLTPERPADALVFVALSTVDLYPDAQWNFVFGQARPANGVGVWSLARFTPPSGAPRADSLLLVRTLRTASHEIGHLLGLPHCVAFECLMNGSNHLDESDARPLELCPVCMAKVCEGLGLDPTQRALRLEETMRTLGLPEEGAKEGKLQRFLAATTP